MVCSQASDDCLWGNGQAESSYWVAWWGVRIPGNNEDTQNVLQVELWRWITVGLSCGLRARALHFRQSFSILPRFGPIATPIFISFEPSYRSAMRRVSIGPDLQCSLSATEVLIPRETNQPWLMITARQISMAPISPTSGTCLRNSIVTDNYTQLWYFLK